MHKMTKKKKKSIAKSWRTLKKATKEARATILRMC